MLGVQGKHQNKPALPFVPGNEMAGEVVALGDGVTNLAVGQRVATGGSQRRLRRILPWPSPPTPCRSPSHALCRGDQLPDALSDRLRRAASWKANMQPGEVLLVHGAGGGSGLTGIEVGKAMGAVVIASAGGADKLAAAREAAGADHLIDYRTEDLRARCWS